LPLLFYTFISSATNYYVKNGGSDSKSGLSDSEAWAHHPWMIGWTGSTILKPGDVIFMKCGNMWTIANPASPFIVVKQNGSIDNFITTTSYGSGPKPIIKITTDSGQSVIYGSGKSYIKFENLDISHFGSKRNPYSWQNGIVYGKDMGITSHNWLIIDCEIHDCPSCGIYGGVDSYDIIIGDLNANKIATEDDHSNHIFNCGYAGIMASGCNPSDENSNWHIYYNYIHNINNEGNEGENAYGITFSTQTDASSGNHKYCYARYNRIENIPTWTALDGHNGSFIYFQHNHVLNCHNYVTIQARNESGWTPINENNYIENNIFEANSEDSFNDRYFILLEGLDSYEMNNIFIRNNEVFYSQRPVNENRAFVVSLAFANGATISGNRFYNGPQNESNGGIWLGTSISNILISGNFITDWCSAINIYPDAIKGAIEIKSNILKSHGTVINISDNSSELIEGNLTILNNTIVVNGTLSYANAIRIKNSGISLAYGNHFHIANNIMAYEKPYSGTFITSPSFPSGEGELQVNNNLYWNSINTSPFKIGVNDYSFSQWNNYGFDNSSFINENPLFENSSGLLNQTRDFYIQKTSPCIDNGANVGLIQDFSGNPISGLPDIGAFEYQNVETPAPVPVAPVYISSSVENASPSKLDLTFNLALANIVPSTSAFSVRVNSNARSVSTVSVSGAKVTLTLSSSLAYGDVVTVAYTKPSTNPLQTTEGGQAASFSAQAVTNKVAAPAPTPAAPAYVSSSVENATPTKLDIIFNLSLANVLPATSAFTVTVNSNTRTVSSVAVSGTKVTLTLPSSIIYGDVITVAYNKPSSNPLQTTVGGQTASFSAQAVTNKVAAPTPTPTAPVYVSSSVENATPSKLDIVLNLSLANIVPAASAFTVAVNSGTRSVNSVSISGTKVTLSLSNPVIYGDVITVAYTKPSSNPLQTSEGGQLASFTLKAVTNKLSAPPPAPAIPVYVSSSVENATPTKIDINFNLALASIIPQTSAFIVMVNSASRTVSSVAVSGTKVTLTLSSPIAAGNVITVAYTKPSANPLQTSGGGQAASFTAQPVSNKVSAVNNNPVLVVNSPKNSYSGFVYELNATGSYDSDKDNLTFSWTAPSNVPVSSTTGPIVKFLGPIVPSPASVEFTLKISDGNTTVSKTIPVEILPYKPELEAAEIVNVEASSYYSQNYPYNIIDGNIGTMWSANGSDQWLLMELRESFNVQHVKLAFQSGQKSESYFDILGSTDKVSWEPILTKSASCGFSGDLQVFDFPPSKAEKEYKYVKMIGLGNSADAWNYISELKIYGYRYHNPSSFENLPVKLYPNPAHEHINIRIDEPNLSFDYIKIFNLNGKIVYQDILDKSMREFVVPLSINDGLYLIQMGSDNLTLYSAKLIVSSR